MSMTYEYKPSHNPQLWKNYLRHLGQMAPEITWIEFDDHMRESLLMYNAQEKGAYIEFVDQESWMQFMLTFS